VTECARPRVVSLVRLVCLLASGCSFGCGQDPVRGDRVPPGTAQGRGSDDPNTLRVNVRLVSIFTTVTDTHGAPISDLSKEDFRVLEDGVPQTISVFDRESELPLNIVLAIDTSESTRKDLKLEVASAKKFVHSVMRPVDHLSVFQITENTDQLTSFSSDVKSLDRGIERLTAGAGTSLYYAESLAQLDKGFQEISDELRTQYLIAYYPNRRVSDSPFRRIQVELNKKDAESASYKVRHRAGYYTAPPR